MFADSVRTAIDLEGDVDPADLFRVVFFTLQEKVGQDLALAEECVAVASDVFRQRPGSPLDDAIAKARGAFAIHDESEIPEGASWCKGLVGSA